MFPDQSDPASDAKDNPQIVYDLSIDRLLELIEPDMNGRDYFLRSIGSPPAHVENILSRQQTLTDFLEIPGLFERFSNLFSRWADLRREWNDARSKTAGRGHVGEASDADYYRAAYRLRGHPADPAFPCDPAGNPSVRNRLPIWYFAQDLPDTAAEIGACQMYSRKESGIAA